MSTVKIDPDKMEEGYYSSELILQDIDPQTKQFKIVSVISHEMAITCVSHY